MKVFLWKDVTQKIFKPRSTLKRTRPVSDTTLELKQSVQKRDEKHEHGHPEYEHETFTSEDADLAEESISDDDQEKHREALRKHPRLMKRLINKGYVKVKKAFFIDKKV